MRVLHIDAGTEMRGGQWQCLNLVAALGNGVRLLAPADSPLSRLALDRGLNVESLNIARLALLSREFDLLHVHDARAHTWAVAVAGAPVVVSRRVAFPIRQSPLSRWKYARPAHYIAVSDCVRQMLVSAGIADDKISVVYDGVAVPDAPARPERIVALESADPMKGTALVRAAAENRFAVHFTSDLDRDLRDASLFLYITHAEGLGSAALLAMAWGVPVVASRIGGLPEIVQDRRTGILTDNDPDAIAQAVAWALDHREELAANARETVAGHFTVGKMVERTTAVYRKVLAC
jgi:hypothetical protein